MKVVYQTPKEIELKLPAEKGRTGNTNLRRTMKMLLAQPTQARSFASETLCSKLKVGNLPSAKKCL